MPKCFLAQFAPAVPCHGRKERAHLVRQQTIKREVWNRREDVKEARMVLGYDPFPSRLYELLWDPRCWVWACGKHHVMLDVERKLRIPPAALPPPLIEFCTEFGLLWWLTREYGETV